MAANEGFKESEEFVYRISTAEEWEELQRSAATFGGDLDQSTGCFHLSKLNQVQSTLQNFFLNVKEDLYLLQIDAKKLGDGLIYEAADDSIIFPHFYGPSRSFSPLPLDAVVKAEKLTLSDGSQCSRKPVIFNFGDSNSDTGGLAAAMGYEFGYPDGRAFFHGPTATGRLCDGRLIIDFLCENVRTNYLSPYLEAVQADFSNGVNFAVGGSATLPRYVAFSLSTQVLQFRRFRNHSLQLRSQLQEDDFRKAVYTIDIGQNDLTAAFNSGPYDQVLLKIPSFISEIKDALWALYLVGGRNFWVHNTGPLGCLPEKLGTRKPDKTELDAYGCIASMNEAARVFNSRLKDACQQVGDEMQDGSSIVYVDVYSIKYNLIANATSTSTSKALMACCGYGGAPYNFDPKIKCRDAGCNLCGEGEGDEYVSWDGVHYTQAANAIVASAILSTQYSFPPLPFNFFCNIHQ